jgi:hypothetical protein
MAIDPFTQREFIPKRKNQKFESKENRIAFNNEKALEFRKRNKDTISPITQNIKIIERIMFEKTQKLIHKKYLEGMGFSFKHFTSIHNIDGKNHFQISNYAIIPKEKNYISIELITQ